MAQIIAFLLLIFCTYAQSKSQDLLSLVDQSTWVFFDLDETILKSQNAENTALIQQVQKSAGAVFGLSACQPPLSAKVLKQLAYIGIDFTFGTPFQPVIENKLSPQWEEGVLFLSDFAEKGEVFRKWLEFSMIRPSKVILIEDKKNRLTDIEETLFDLGIPCKRFEFKAKDSE